MVTHNPELANEYATRIVRLSDGRIRADSSPYTPPETPSAHKKWARRSSMSFLTAFALSFQNLRSKKARTLLTAFAGSIGIIGIALILSLSNGVNRYIETVEEARFLGISAADSKLGNGPFRHDGRHGGCRARAGEA